MNRIRNLYKRVTRIFYSGITDDMPFAEVQKTILFNLFLMIGFPFITAGIPLKFINGDYALALMNCLLFVLYIAGMWINARQKYLWGRTWVLILASCMYIIGPLFFRNGTEYNLLITLMAGVILFNSNLLFFLYSLIVIISVTYIRVRDINVLGLSSYASASPYINIFYSQLLFVFSIYSFKYIYYKYQKQLELAYENLKKSKEAKDRILRVVAHDLRSPVGGITSLASILLDEKDALNNDQKKYVQMIHRASAQSLDLINELLQNDIDDAVDLVTSKTEINELLANVARLLQHKADEKKQSIELILPDIPVIAVCDAEKITRVIQNLVSNAIKFTQENGNIVLSTVTEKGMNCIKVTDNGIGIPVTMQANLFDMFTKSKRKGTSGEESFGIGLSVCKKIMEAHNGKIYVESIEGEGSAFTLQLPFQQVLIQCG